MSCPRVRTEAGCQVLLGAGVGDGDGVIPGEGGFEETGDGDIEGVAGDDGVGGACALGDGVEVPAGGVDEARALIAGNVTFEAGDFVEEAGAEFGGPGRAGQWGWIRRTVRRWCAGGKRGDAFAGEARPLGGGIGVGDGVSVGAGVGGAVEEDGFHDAVVGGEALVDGAVDELLVDEGGGAGDEAVRQKLVPAREPSLDEVARGRGWGRGCGWRRGGRG